MDSMHSGTGKMLITIAWAAYALCALLCLVMVYPPLVLVIAFALAVGVVMALEYFVLGILPGLFANPRRGWPWSLSTVLMLFICAPPLLVLAIGFVQIWLAAMQPHARPATYLPTAIQAAPVRHGPSQASP